MKIAYFVNQYPKVSHSFIRREIQALERQGFDIQRIAVHGWDEPLPDEADQLELARTRYIMRRGLFALVLPTLRMLVRSPERFWRAICVAVKLARESDRSLPYHLVYLAEACCIVPWMEAFGATRIHAHFGNNPTEIAMLAFILGGPPYSFTIHGPTEFFIPLSLKEKIGQSAFVVAVSSYGRSQLFLNAQRIHWPKINVVRCGLEKAFHEHPAVIVAEPARLVCIGRLCKEKGQVLLIDAVARLAAKGIRLQLVLVGDGPLRKTIEALIATHDLAHAVRITGWISGDAVRSEILAARALVLPSFAEGLPVVLMEALALRRPVLTTYVAGIPELIKHGENGWLIPAGSVNDLADALEDCLSRSPEDIRRMGDSGHDLVIARHSVDVEAAKLGALFRVSPVG